MLHEPVRVALVQASPVYFDLAASMDLAEKWTREAAETDAKLIVFGETWLPGYPTWIDTSPKAALWGNPDTKAVYANLRRNSITIPGPDADRLAGLAKELEITLVMGANERIDSGPGSGTLYNSILTFGPDGSLLNHHRKMVPTFTEKLLWGAGDSVGLKVIETPVGRLSGLICWEHWMPLARHELHSQGEDIHVALWPGIHDAHQVASRHYAFEGRCYVLAVGSIMRVKDLPSELPPSADLVDKPDEIIINGGSAVIGPDGNYIVEPVYGEETIITAELDPDALEAESMTLDVAGHYSRPDIFTVEVQKGASIR